MHALSSSSSSTRTASYLLSNPNPNPYPNPNLNPNPNPNRYPETVGGPELLGSFTVYTQHDFDRLTAADATELTAINTATLPPELLAPADLYTADAISYAPATPAAAAMHAPADAAGMEAEAVAVEAQAARTAHEAAMTKRADAADAPPPSPPPTDCSPATTRRRRSSREGPVACSLDVRAADECEGVPPQALLRLLSPKFPMQNGTRRRDAGSGPPR